MPLPYVHTLGCTGSIRPNRLQLCRTRKREGKKSQIETNLQFRERLNIPFPVPVLS